MAISEVTVIDRIEILEDESIHVRRSRRILDNDGSIIAERYHRVAYSPITPLSEINGVRVRRVAELIWTPAVIQAYKDKMGIL